MLIVPMRDKSGDIFRVCVVQEKNATLSLVPPKITWDLGRVTLVLRENFSTFQAIWHVLTVRQVNTNQKLVVLPAQAVQQANTVPLQGRFLLTHVKHVLLQRILLTAETAVYLVHQG